MKHKSFALFLIITNILLIGFLIYLTNHFKYIRGFDVFAGYMVGFVSGMLLTTAIFLIKNNSNQLKKLKAD